MLTISKEAIEKLAVSELEQEFRAYDNRIARLTKEHERLWDGLRKLVDKLELLHKDEKYMGVWTLYASHGFVYKGPTYENELTAAKALLERK